MAVVLKLTCPVCGGWLSLYQLKNIGRQKLRAFRVMFGGKVKGGRKGRGRAKGKIVYVEVPFVGPDTIQDFWIKNLNELIERLSGGQYNISRSVNVVGVGLPVRSVMLSRVNTGMVLTHVKVGKVSYE